MRYAILLTSICLVPAFDIAAQTEKPAVAEPAKAAIYRDPISDFEPGEAKATDVVTLLNEQFPNLKFSAEPTTNRIYGRVPETQVEDIEQFVHELANVAAKHRREQEKRRQLQMDEEAERREREEKLLQERAAEERADLEARYDQLVNDGFSSGITLSMPLGLRIAQTQQRHAELELQKLLAIYGPNHPEVRNAELQIEAIKHLQKPQFHLFDQYRVEAFANSEPHPLVEQPAKLAEVLKQLRPDLDVKIEGTDNGQLIFSGSETSVAEAERVIKALQDVTVGTNPATLQGQYEDAERSAAEVAGQLREANSAMSPDRKRIAELRAHLTDSVQLAFDLRLQLQQYQLERAEADLTTARARLIRREQIAEQIIKRRVEELENSDDTAWSPAHAQRGAEEPQDRNALQVHDVRRRLSAAEAQYEEATAVWVRDRKKLMSEREQLASQVDDLREKLKAATRVGFDSPREPDEEQQPQRFESANPNAKQQPSAPQDNPSAVESAMNFGIRFGKVTDLGEYKTNYRGGIRITSVVPNSPADKAGIEAGDILVGLETWETTSLADLAFVLKKLTESFDKDSVKFFVMRKGETMTGEMSIPEFTSAEASQRF